MKTVLNVRLIFWSIVILWCKMTVFHVPLHAQEIQIPFDEAGQIMVITAEMEKDFRLFADYENFVEARLYRLVDSTFMIEITQNAQGQLLRNRKPMSTLELQAFRTRLMHAMASNPLLHPDEQLSSWEKTSQVIGAGLTGLFYGLAADGASTPYYRYGRNTSVAPWTLLTPLVYAGVTIYAVNQDWFTRSASTMFTHGILSGFVHGGLLYGAVASERGFSSEGLWGTAIAGGFLQAITTMRLPERWGFTLGQTSVFTNLSVSGTIAGFLLPATFGAFEGRGWSSNAFCVAALGFSAAGYWVGHSLAQNQYYAGGDATVLTLPATLGLFLPVASSIVADDGINDGRILTGLMVGSHILGYVLGNSLIKDKDFTFDQGRAISTAAWLGTLPGIVTLYAARDGGGLVRISPLLSLIGATIGFTIAYNNNVEEARQNNAKRRAAGGVGYSNPENEGWWQTFTRNSDVQFSPLGLVGLLTPSIASSGFSLPLFNYRYTFTSSKNTTPSVRDDEP